MFRVGLEHGADAIRECHAREALQNAAMDFDHTFRMLMVVGFSLLLPIGVYYRL